MGWFLGGLDGFLYALLMFVVIDYATGLMAAFVQKKVSSEVGFKGICKKVAIFCLVGIGHVLDTQVIQNGSVLRTAVIFFYLSNEGISIIENVALIGLPVPKKLNGLSLSMYGQACNDVLSIPHQELRQHYQRLCLNDDLRNQWLSLCLHTVHASG